MAQQARGMPGRPSIEPLSSSVSTGFTLDDDGSSRGHGYGPGGLGMDEDGDTVEALMNRLEIEQRIQFGAEKMLDVIEQRSGADQGQVRGRITSQLEAANDRIKVLESKLERLRGSTQSHRQRRRPTRLNGLGMTSGLSSSASSSTVLSAGLRPHAAYQGSITSDGGDMTSVSSTPSRLRYEHHGDMSPTSPRMFGRSMTSDTDADGEPDAVAESTVARNLRRLRELGATASLKGKGKEVERGDEPWDCMTRLADLFKGSTGLHRHVDTVEVIRTVLPFLADTSTSRRRSAAYRLLRYILSRRTWGRMVNAGVECLIIRTFTRDAKAVHEREQALRLIRAVVVLGEPTEHDLDRVASKRESDPPDPVAVLLTKRVPLRQGLVRAIVSAAENPDDAMHTVCMETLVEIALFDLECLLQADAFRVILNAFKDGPFELGLGMTGLMLYLANSPETRRLLIKGSDVETVLVGLTEQYGKVPTRQMQKHLDKLDVCVRNVGMLLGSWSGLLYMCLDDCRAIKSLISSLHVPMTEMRNALLDLFFSAFRIKAPSWTSAFLDGRRLTVYNRAQEASKQLQDREDEEEMPQRLSIVDNYVAFLLAIFIEAGLLEALGALIQDEEATANVSRKATLLLGEILQLANHTLPLQYAARIQALPALFKGVTQFSKPSERNAALAALSSIDSLFRNNAKRGQAVAVRHHVPGKGSVQESLLRSQRHVQQVKLRLGLQMDDKQFQTMINDTGVLLTRDHTKWNTDLIMELLQGPLLNPKRLDEAIKATKFIRRLFSFLHPANNRFSAIMRTRPNYKWVKLACALLTTMLINPEGQRFLAEDKLLRQMVECLTELDAYAGQPSSRPLFTRDRLEATLTFGYFEMIGTLSKHQKGIQLLEKFRFFTCFYHLCELRSREDIINLTIECFDYSIDGHQRIVLSKALTSSYMDTRLFATHHLGRLLQESPGLVDWVLQLLVTQLYDPSSEVVETAVMYLEEACTDPVYLEKVVYLRPSLEHLGDIGANLFLKFMSTSAGFLYLLQAQYIDYELENWLTVHNTLYVLEVETFVSKTIRPYSKDSVDEYWAYEGTAPTHFFGELCKTPEGCQYLREKGLVPEFADIIRLHGMESADQTVMATVKSALWAMGNIGATEGGLAFLEDEEIIDVIIEIAEQSPVLTMKGTCFFVIGLISSTQMGAEILEEYGWISVRTPLSQTTGLCIPNDIQRFAYIEPWQRPDIKGDEPPLPVLSGLEGEVMQLISKLSNYVLAAGAMNNLKRVRNRHPRLFSSITFFYRALRAISTNHFQAPVRKFILDLFDVELGPTTLPRLTHLERGSYLLGPSHPDECIEDGHDGECNGHDQNGNDSNNKSRETRNNLLLDAEGDPRPRARSSPGPDPTQRTPESAGRPRGVTISETTPSRRPSMLPSMEPMEGQGGKLDNLVNLDRLDELYRQDELQRQTQQGEQDAVDGSVHAQ